MSSCRCMRVAAVALLGVAAGPVLLEARGAGPPERDAGPSSEEERKLIALLRSDAALFDKARACQRLAVIGGREAVPALAALLGDERLGDYARSGMEPIADASVDDALREAMGRLQGRALAGVVNSIGVRRDAKAVSGLARLARGPDAGEVAAAALAALGEIGNEDAVRVIRRALAAGPEALRPASACACLAAAERLLARGRRDEAAELYDAVRRAEVPGHLRAAATYHAILVRCSANGPAGSRLLVEQLGSDDPAMVEVAIRAARESPGREVTRALVAGLGGFRPGVQVLLVRALATRADPGVLGGIGALAASGTREVRVESLKALGEIGDASAVGLLLKAAGGGGEEEAAARGSLRVIKGDGVDDALIAAVPTCADELRPELISVLADRRSGGAVPVLLGQAAGGDARAAQAAFKALETLAAGEHVPAMVKALAGLRAGDVQAAAERAVAAAARRIPDGGGRLDAIREALSSAREDPVRCSLIRVLGRIGDEGGLAPVADAADDDTGEVRDAAVRALSAWPDARAAPILLGIARGTPDAVHRVLALRGYVRLLGLAEGRDPRRTVRQYAEVLDLMPGPDAKKLVLAGLAGVGHVDALGLAMELLDDPAVRSEAALAAVEIARAVMGTDRREARAAMEKVAAVSGDGRVAAEARRIVGQIDAFGDSITAWRIAGPYSQEGRRYSQLFDIAFEPEKPRPAGVEWRPLPAGTDPERPFILDLLKAVGGEQRVVYALTWIHSEASQPVRLELGSDDGVKAWLDGRLVHANNAARAARAYTDRADVELKEGWNPLLLKITQNDSPWEFCARISGRDGQRLDNIRADPAHEGDWALPGRAPPDPAPTGKGTRIFDGRTFAGWEGNLEWFRIEDGAIVGGDLKRRIPRNEFLCATKEYADFVLRLKVKLVGNRGNAGVQFRSRRIPDHHEMIGYQADVAEGIWGSLYDESRRGRVLAGPDPGELARVLEPAGWNEYVIRCEGRRIQLWLNGRQTVDYTEPDANIPRTGLIGLQIHSGDPSEVWYKDIEILELP